MRHVPFVLLPLLMIPIGGVTGAVLGVGAIYLNLRFVRVQSEGSSRVAVCIGTFAIAFILWAILDAAFRGALKLDRGFPMGW